jgi:hypothetical protein
MKPPDIWLDEGNKQVFVLKKQEKNKKTCQSTPMNSTVKKRSIVIGGHKTSISLEDIFWTRGLWMGAVGTD